MCSIYVSRAVAASEGWTYTLDNSPAPNKALRIHDSKHMATSYGFNFAILSATVGLAMVGLAMVAEYFYISNVAHLLLTDRGMEWQSR